MSVVCFSGELNESINCFCHLLSFTTFIEQMSCYLCLLTGKLESEPFRKNTPYLLPSLLKTYSEKIQPEQLLLFWFDFLWISLYLWNLVVLVIYSIGQKLRPIFSFNFEIFQKINSLIVSLFSFVYLSLSAWNLITS